MQRLWSAPGELRCGLVSRPATILAATILLATPLSAQSWTHTDYTIPIPNSTSYGIVAGPDGNLWFGASGKMFRLSPDGTFTPFDTPEGTAFAVTVGPDGAIWYTTFNPGKRIGRITTAGVVTTFDVVTSALPENITAGPDGNIWFTIFCDDALYRMTLAGVVTRFPVPTAGACAYGVTAGPDGNLWFTEHYRNKIGRMTPDGQVTEFRIGPVDQDYPNGIVTGPDGNLWATSNYGHLRRITPAGEITEPFGVGYGAITVANGFLWTTGYDAVYRFGMNSVGAAFPLPDTDHLALGIAVLPDGTAWFPEIYTGAIGRVLINTGFFTVTPCRLMDTRNTGIPIQGTPSNLMTFPLCGIPATVRAIAANVTVVDPVAPGHLNLFPSGTPVPATSALNYKAGETRANNVILSLGLDTMAQIQAVQLKGGAHVLVDVVGYFQ